MCVGCVVYVWACVARVWRCECLFVNWLVNGCVCGCVGSCVFVGWLVSDYGLGFKV